MFLSHENLLMIQELNPYNWVVILFSLSLSLEVLGRGLCEVALIQDKLHQPSQMKTTYFISLQ